MKTGFIGLGHMGSGIAANLLKAGHDVTVYNRTAGRADPLVAQGAKRAASVADACRGEVVMTMLSDDDAIENVVFGDKGIIANLAVGAIHVSLSTISVAMSERLTAEHTRRNQGYVAAPVFGRPEAAAAAKLFVVAAGAKAAVAACDPLFSAIGQKTWVVSETPKDANIVKLSGNFLIGSVIEAMGEAIALVGKSGIDRQHYLDFMTSSLFTAPVYKIYGQLIVDGKFEPPAFAAPLGYKDVRLALAAAEKLNVPMPIASLLRDRFITLFAQGGENLDWSAIGRLPAQDSGQIKKAE